MQETLYSSSSTNHSPTQGPRMPFWQRPKQWSMAETGLSHQNLLQWAKISFEFDKLKSVMCTMCIHMYLAHWEIFWKEDDFFCLLKRTYIYTVYITNMLSNFAHFDQTRPAKIVVSWRATGDTVKTCLPELQAILPAWNIKHHILQTRGLGPSRMHPHPFGKKFAASLVAARFKIFFLRILWFFGSFLPRSSCPVWRKLVQDIWHGGSIVSSSWRARPSTQEMVGNLRTPYFRILELKATWFV